MESSDVSRGLEIGDSGKRYLLGNEVAKTLLIDALEETDSDLRDVALYYLLQKDPGKEAQEKIQHLAMRHFLEVSLVIKVLRRESKDSWFFESFEKMLIERLSDLCLENQVVVLHKLLRYRPISKDAQRIVIAYLNSDDNEGVVRELRSRHPDAHYWTPIPNWH